MLPRPKLPDVARHDQHHRGTPRHDRLMEVVVGAFPVMNGCRLNGPRIPGPPDDQVLRRPVDLMDRVQIVVLQVRLIHLEHRHDVHFPAIQQLHPERPRQGRVNAALAIVPAHQLPMDRHRLILVQIPHHEPAQPGDDFGLHRLHFARIALGEVRELIIRDDFPRI